MKTSELKWQCIKNCGACCRLAPGERREALNVLDNEQLEIYLKMVGQDGWCIHFDSATRSCTIYDVRPDFCRVSNLARLFGVDPNYSESYAVQCCTEQITSIYGEESDVMRTFSREVNQSQETL